MDNQELEIYLKIEFRHPNRSMSTSVDERQESPQMLAM